MKRGKLYKALEQKIIVDLKNIATIVKEDMTETEKEVREYILGASLESKKTWLRLYVKKL